MKFSREIKFTAAIAAIFLVPFFITLFQSSRDNARSHKLYTSGYMEMRVQSAARLVSEALEENYNLSVIVNSDEFKRKGKAALPDLLKKMPMSYYEAVLLDSKGKEIYRVSSGEGSDYSYEGSVAVSEAARTGNSAGNIEYSRYMPPALVVAEPLPDKKGFAAGRFSLAYIGMIVRRLGKGSYGSMGIMDSGGQVIADSLGVSATRPGMAAPEEMIRAIEYAGREKISSLVREASGKKREYLIAVAAIEGTGWWFYEVLDTRFMPFAKDGFRTRYTAVSGAMLIIACSFAACLLAKYMFGGK